MSAVEAPPVTDLDAFLLDEFPTPEGPARDGYRIGGDREAAWAFRKLTAAKEEIARLEAQAKLHRDQIASWLDGALAGPKADAAFFESVLIDYRRRLDRDAPEGKPVRKTYPVPGGTLAKRKGPLVVEVTDEDAFVAWALVHDPAAVKITPQVSRVKDAYTVPEPPKNEDEWDGPVLLEGGETIPGVRARRKPPTFSASPTNQPTDPQE